MVILPCSNWKFSSIKSRLLFLAIYNKCVKRISPATVFKARESGKQRGTRAQIILTSLLGLKFGLEGVFLSAWKKQAKWGIHNICFIHLSYNPEEQRQEPVLPCRITVKMQDCLGGMGIFLLPQKGVLCKEV